MKFFRLVLCVCLLVNCFFFYCFADSTSVSAIEDSSEEGQEAITYSDNSSGTTVIVNPADNSELINTIQNLIDSNNSEDRIYSSTSSNMQLMSVNVSNERISSGDAIGFKAVVLDLIGDYETVITDYTYQNQQGYTQHSIDVTPDWCWIASAGIFIIVVFCSLKMIGGFLCNR